MLDELFDFCVEANSFEGYSTYNKSQPNNFSGHVRVSYRNLWQTHKN